MRGVGTFSPPPGLRSAHVQTVLASGPLRRKLVRRRAAELRRQAEPVILDAGAGVRLTALHNAAREPARGLLVLLHGWEGSAESSYVLETAMAAFAAGWEILRLNLRDHGDSHALNRGLFHSCLLDEAVGALAEIARRWPARPLALAGFSLGGNFALRMALAAPAADIPLAAVFAICPVIDPARSLDAMAAPPGFYRRYFEHKWRRSLRRKQAAFPDTPLFTPEELHLGLRELTRLMVLRHTTLGSLEAYFDGYSLAGERLRGLAVPARILASRDDPVIPAADFAPLRDIPAIRLELPAHGGHCGFIADWHLHSWCASWLLAGLEATSG